MFTVLSRFEVANGKSEEVRAAFRARPHLVDSAPGFIRMEVLSPRGRPEEFWLITWWTAEEHYDTWHRSHAYHDSHRGIPKGLKLVPKSTQIRAGEPRAHRAGELWQANRFSVAEEHYFTAVTQRVMGRLFSDRVQGRGRGPAVVVACVAGELHELGARMVCDLLELEGYNCHYLGASMPPRAIVDFASLRGARVLGLSASIAPYLGTVREAIALLRADPRCAGMKVLVGGAAFSGLPTLWRSVGADGWAPEAAAAIDEVRRLAA